jgi:hypothetical protein
MDQTRRALIPFRSQYHGSRAAATFAKRVLANPGKPQAISLKSRTVHQKVATHWAVLTTLDGAPTVRWTTEGDTQGSHALLSTWEKIPGAEVMAHIAAVTIGALASEDCSLSVDPDPCPDCGGTGDSPRKGRDSDVLPCPTCGGDGWADD